VYLQASYITVAPTQIVVELDLSPGVLVASHVLQGLDTNADQQISDAESQTYVDAVLHQIELQVDGQPLALQVTKIQMPPYLTIQAGYGTIRIFTTAALPDGMTGTHSIYYRNNYTPTGAAYQVNAFVDRNVAIVLGTQNRDSIQQSMRVDYVIGNTALAATTTAMTTAGSESTFPASNTMGQAQQLLGYLSAPVLSPWVLLLALALAGALGGLHALTPGHGKTLVAAYLVGSRGTVRHAIALGATVTFTHTASVVAIGLLALFASQFVVPGVLVPLLEVISGLLVVLMGARLVWRRWGGMRGHPGDYHRHAHNSSAHHGEHAHGLGHDHGEHTHGFSHDHGDGHVHTHLPPADGITAGSLLALGMSGGLIPCPEALGIMVIAIGLNRIGLGLGLIVAFSIGLAAVLIAIGVLLVRARPLVERFSGAGSRWSAALPLVSAALVTLLGIGMTLSGLATYLG
jgi:ABC-type nickel/cobalt efflux system permease component RcnA